MDFTSLLFYFLIIIPSSIVHEYAHGWMADQLGDKTARYAGRLTLDPRAHIDPFGTIGLPIFLYVLSMFSGRPFLFAYAKPVPYNPYNLKDQKWGPVLVGLAGPAANFLLAACFAVLIRLWPGALISQFFAIIVYANVLLMVFNLVPIPPLDGSKILYAVLPDSWSNVRQALDRYGFMIVLFFALFLFGIITPLIDLIASGLTGYQF